MHHSPAYRTTSREVEKLELLQFIVFDGILKALFSYFTHIPAKINSLISFALSSYINLLISKIRESTWHKFNQTSIQRYGVTTQRNRMPSLKMPLALMKPIILRIVLFGDVERSRFHRGHRVRRVCTCHSTVKPRHASRTL